MGTRQETFSLMRRSSVSNYVSLLVGLAVLREVEGMLYCVLLLFVVGFLVLGLLGSFGRVPTYLPS